MNDPQHQRPRGGRRGELEFSPADELIRAVLLAVLLGAHWLAATIYS
jgi:hypothetical protein